MFTWICQKCGSEVPPSENDCPNCRIKAASAQQPEAVPSPPPLVSAVTPSPIPPASAPITHPSPSAPAPVPPPIRETRLPDIPPSFAAASQPVAAKGLSPTIVAIGSAVGILAVLAVLYLYVLPKSSEKTDASALETPAASGSAASDTPTHPLAKYIEITGLRIIEEGKGQVKIAYVVVNHSPADLPELQAQLVLGAAGKQFFEFPAKIPSIGPYESKDLSASVRTRLQPYELPDWQKLTPAFKILGER